MFTKSSIQVPADTFNQAINNLPTVDFRLSLNEQTGRYLYDPWIIKEDYKGTIWEEILKTLPGPIGEARIVVLKPGSGYQSHSDIDDRYHLNLLGDRYSYLIDIDKQQLYQVTRDRFWYNMNAGPRHSAVNLGSTDRVQLVVRKLLNDVTLEKSVRIVIQSKGVNDSSRFLFDDIISPWLNSAIKKSIVSNFEFEGNLVKFDISEEFVHEFTNLDLSSFMVEIK